VDARELQQETAARTQGADEDAEPQPEGTCEPTSMEPTTEPPQHSGAKGQSRNASPAEPHAPRVERAGPRAGMPHTTRRKPEDRVAPAAQDREVEKNSAPLDNGDIGGAAAGRAPRGRTGQEASGPQTPPSGRPRGVPGWDNNRDAGPQAPRPQRPTPRPGR
jgi:hypothetical protein